jgi:hypothetical protein
MFYPTSFRLSARRVIQRSFIVSCWLAGGAAGLAGDAPRQAVPRATPVATAEAPQLAGTASGYVLLMPDDTYLNLDGANYSGSEILATYTWPDYQVANAIVMKFDLSAVPAGSVVTGAALHLALLDADLGPEATYAVGVHRILHGNLVVGSASGLTRDGATPWTPTSCCFSSIPLAQADISSAVDRPAIDKAPGFKSWTVTSMVQQWLADPSSNFGLLLNSDTGRLKDRYRVFASADNANIGLRPYLSVAFNAGGTGRDRTRPSVSITSPAAGATVSGSVPVTASASDDVGVVGVRFLVDGQPTGAEDTTAPYGMTWNATNASAGSHTLSAVARDAAGNTRRSSNVSVTVAAPVGGGGGGGDGGGGGGGGSSTAVFSSNWSAATGNSAVAVGDGGRWPNVWEFNGGSSVQLMSVVTGGPSGHNALRVQQRGSTYAANLQIDNALPQSTDFYMRYYMRNDDTSSAGDHVVTADTYQYANLTYMRKMGSPTGWNIVMSLFGCGYTYPIGHWAPSAKLQNGAWYRFEYFVDYVDATHVQVHPRVYDASGTLILSDAQFRQSDFGSAAWNGRSDWTLASYYAAGHSFCVNPQFTNDFGLGNNGQQGAADTGLYWYFAGFEVRTDGWPGAIGPAGSSPSPSSLSSLYPGDVGIESDPSVLFAEKFDDASLSTVFSRWSDVLRGSTMLLTTDVPAGSPSGSRSLDIPWSGGGASNGGHLFRQLPPVDDTLYVRYYIKYPASGEPQHEGVWLGGYNPATTWPNPQAGVRPGGADRFSAAVETSGSPLRVDHYNYWMGMRPDGLGNYWGNTLLNNPGVTVQREQWVCVEHMVKLNNPVSASNGEHAVWINGVKVSHLGQGFPAGGWSGGNFIQSATGSPFEGFRWRSDANLRLNWIWLQNYAPNEPAGFTGHLKFDQLVVATRYIGCLAPVPAP